MELNNDDFYWMIAHNMLWKVCRENHSGIFVIPGTLKEENDEVEEEDP